MKAHNGYAWSDIELFCKTCNCIENVVLCQNGPHIEARCEECLTFIKFIKQKHNDPGQGYSCPPTIMAKGLYGSICLEDLFGQFIAKDNTGRQWLCLDNLQQKPFEISQKNGKHYVGISVWINDDYDQYQNIGSVVLSQTQEQRQQNLKKVYLGNLKYMQQPQAAAPQQGYVPPASQGFAQPNTYQQPAQQPYPSGGTNYGQQPQQNWNNVPAGGSPQAAAQMYPALPTAPYGPAQQPGQPMGQGNPGGYPQQQAPVAGPGQYPQGAPAPGTGNFGAPAQGQIGQAVAGDLPF